MSVIFQADGHKYTSVDQFDEINWVSASRLSGMFKKKFDPVKTSIRCSQKKGGKWYGITPQEIRDYWIAENVRSTTLGTWYHEKEEKKLLGLDVTQRYGKEFKIIRSIWDGDVKVAPNQKLTPGIYPEHFAYLKSVGACGQFDEVIIDDEWVDIDDHKSNKDLMKPAFVNWEGVVDKMEPPLLHLDNCKLNEYALQLSIGMYMVLRHNPQLKARNMTLNHVTFEIESEDRFGYPILKLENNEPIIKDVKKVPVPYMKREVELVFDYLKRTKNV